MLDLLHLLHRPRCVRTRMSRVSCTLSHLPHSYDLTGLPSVTVYDDARRKYMISVCKNVGSQCPNSHSCIVGLDNNVTEAGNSFRFIPDADNCTFAALYPSPLLPLFSPLFSHCFSVCYCLRAWRSLPRNHHRAIYHHSVRV